MGYSHSEGKHYVKVSDNVIDFGTIDPAKKLPEFIEKLKAAGIEKVIAEKQKQLDAWAAAKQ